MDFTTISAYEITAYSTSVSDLDEACRLVLKHYFNQ